MAIELPKKHQKLKQAEVVALCLEAGQYTLAKIIKNSPYLSDFSSDGASCFPDNVKGVDIYPAAFWHDVAYWCGVKGDDETRLIADCQLAIDIVVECGGSAELADIVLRGVRAGGNELLPTPWRWGFGSIT